MDAPTPQPHRHRWIQAKPESTDGFVGSAFGAGGPGGRWAGACVRAGAFWGVWDWSAGLVRWWRVGFGCAAPGALRRLSERGVGCGCVPGRW